jgi:hypothetical protein
MAIPSTMEWEFQPVGIGTANAAGGGFDPVVGVNGINYCWGPQQQMATWATSGGNYPNDLTATSATNSLLNSVSRNFWNGDVGNVINITAGTNFVAGRYCIIGISGTQAILDRNCTTGSNASTGSAVLGGAFPLMLVFLGVLNGVAQPGNSIWIWNGGTSTGVTYSFGGGYTVTFTGTSAQPIVVSGYKTSHWETTPLTANDRPLLDFTSNGLLTAAISASGCTNVIFKSLRLLGHGSSLFTVGADCLLRWIYAHNTSSIEGAGNYSVQLDRASAVDCEFCSDVGYAVYQTSAYNIHLIRCYVHDSVIGFYMAYGMFDMSECIGDSCRIGVNLGLSGAVGRWAIKNCTFANNVYHLYAPGASTGLVDNCILAFANYGAAWAAPCRLTQFQRCNWYGNTVDNDGVNKGQDNTAYNPLFTSPYSQGTDGVTNSGDGKRFSAASGPFSGVTLNDFLIVLLGSGALQGPYRITSVYSDTELGLDVSPGINLSGIPYRIFKGSDFSLQTSSQCLGTGYGMNLGVGSWS